MEESKTAEDALIFVEGMQFDRGYYSPYFVTDPERMVGWVGAVGERKGGGQGSKLVWGGGGGCVGGLAAEGLQGKRFRSRGIGASVLVYQSTKQTCELNLFYRRPHPQLAEYENCRILLVDKKISTARDIIGILEAAIRGNYPLLIMAEDVEQEALATLVVNKLRGTLKVRGRRGWKEGGMGQGQAEAGAGSLGQGWTCSIGAAARGRGRRPAAYEWLRGASVACLHLLLHR